MQHRGPQWTIKLPSCDYVLPRPKGPQEPPWLNYLLFCRARLDGIGKPPHRHRKHRLVPPEPPSSPLQDTGPVPLTQQQQSPQYYTPVTAAGSYWPPPSPHDDHPYLLCRPPIEALYQQGDVNGGSRASLLCPWREMVQHRPKGPWTRRELLEDDPRELPESPIAEPLPCTVDVGDGDGTPRPTHGDARDVLLDEQEEIVAFLGEVDERHERQLAFERVLLEASGSRRWAGRRARTDTSKDSLDIVVRAAALQRSVSDHILYDGSRRAFNGRSADWPLQTVKRESNAANVVGAQGGPETEPPVPELKASATEVPEQKCSPVGKVSRQNPRDSGRRQNTNHELGPRDTKESGKRNTMRGTARGGGDTKKATGTCYESQGNNKKTSMFPRKEFHNKRYGDVAQQDCKNDSAQGSTGRPRDQPKPTHKSRRGKGDEPLPPRSSLPYCCRKVQTSTQGPSTTGDRQQRRYQKQRPKSPTLRKCKDVSQSEAPSSADQVGKTGGSSPTDGDVAKRNNETTKAKGSARSLDRRSALSGESAGSRRRSLSLKLLWKRTNLTIFRRKTP